MHFIMYFVNLQRFKSYENAFNDKSRVCNQINNRQVKKYALETENRTESISLHFRCLIF